MKRLFTKKILLLFFIQFALLNFMAAADDLDSYCQDLESRLQGSSLKLYKFINKIQLLDNLEETSCDGLRAESYGEYTGYGDICKAKLAIYFGTEELVFTIYNGEVATGRKEQITYDHSYYGRTSSDPLIEIDEKLENLKIKWQRLRLRPLFHNRFRLKIREDGTLSSFRYKGWTQRKHSLLRRDRQSYRCR